MILQRIGERPRRRVALQEALPIIALHRAAITEEFHQLYPRLQEFVGTTLQEIELHY